MEYWEAAMTFLNTPFRHRGRTPRGLDCVGLCKLAAIMAGRDPQTIQDLKVYGHTPWRDGLQQYLRKNFGVWYSLEEREPQVNDTLLLWPPKSTGPSHVAIVCPHMYGLGMIHTYAEIKRVVTHLLNDTPAGGGISWRDQIVEIYPW